MNDILTIGKRAKGRREYSMFIKGKKLSFMKSIWAKCYECECGYNDGVAACEIQTCPLYPYNPYNHKPKKHFKSNEESLKKARAKKKAS